MKLNYFIFAFFIGFAFTACKDEVKKDTPETVEVASGDDVTLTKPKTVESNTISFNNPRMEVVFNNYIDLKDTFVASNAEKVSAIASELILPFTNIGAGDSALKALETIAKSTAIEEQRTAFVVVTSEIEKLVKDEIASGTIYKQYCPMAFNNTGASWLSTSSDIMNPYFGDKMLRCGRIDAKIE